MPPSLSPFSAARSEAQTLKGRDRSEHADLFAISLAQTREFANRSGHRSDAPQLRCRARAHGRETLSEEDGNREAGTVDWAKKTSVRRTPARHCACSALLDCLPAWRLLHARQPDKKRGLKVHAKHNQAMQHHAKIMSRHAKIVQKNRETV